MIENNLHLPEPTKQQQKRYHRWHFVIRWLLSERGPRQIVWKTFKSTSFENLTFSDF